MLQLIYVYYKPSAHSTKGVFWFLTKSNNNNNNTLSRSSLQYKVVGQVITMSLEVEKGDDAV